MRVDKAKLRAYLDGELSEPDRDVVEKRLAGSEQLQATLARLRQERDQVAEALAMLTPPVEAASPAGWALKRLQTRLNFDGQAAPSRPEKSLPKPDDTVWESPSLLTEIMTDLKNFRYSWRQSMTRGFVFVTVAGLMLIVSAIAFAVWPGVQQQVAEQVRQIVTSEIVELPVTAAPDVQTTTVVVALQPISRGSEFVPGSIGHRGWPARNLPSGFISDEAKALGKIARTDIGQGQVIVRGMLVDEAEDMPELSPGVTPVSAVFNHEIELVGYKLEQETLAPNGAIDLTLYWHSLQEVARDYTIFIHLVDASGLILSQEDRPPIQGKRPTSQWATGQVLEDIHHLPVAANLPMGKYDLVVGLYDNTTGERLSVQSESSLTQDSSIVLTNVQIGKVETAAFELKNVRKLTPCENAGRNHLFIKVQDATGQGINGVPVKIQWSSAADGFVVAETETKQNLSGALEAGYIDFAMFDGTYTVEIQGATSEIASGLTPNYGVDEPCGTGSGNSPYHESFEVIFQQTTEMVSAVPFGYGIQVDPKGNTELNISSIQELDFEWVKFQMPWKVVEPTQGSYDWATWDKVIDAYAADNIKVMLNIVKAPDWARPVDDDKSVEGFPTDPATYAEFVARVADRYRGKVQAIEVWDEQNLWYKSGGKGWIDAANYVKLLQLSYPAVKAANQEMLVISGGLTPAGNLDDLAIDDVEYLKQMYASGVNDYFDVLGAHPSGYNCPVLADWRTVTPEEAGAASFLEPFTNRHHSWCFLGTMEAYREVMVANGDGGKAITITEFGWAVGDSPQPGYTYALDNTPVERTKWLVEAFQWGKTQGWVGPMILWNLDYSLTTPVTELGYFSIYYTSAYEALVKMPK